ncbi:MAG: hypothetical protein GW762_05455 [Candidatus Pacebacteria bacterium]|nr:hypothetical protein [Candidatus Paceibacterota bacterium]PIR63881.1 MAG: hypothetical protein COU64_02830 [Candidatus Pacebacteria bacterium CG10_big_fil_rev_8_21_14_0_10_40_26]PIZ78342.1 MAG: hypothetical protein COY01_06200 [Candidatus Pacebacteria bacterium CG_4_10_14_0_2_um_filter_40_20]PJA68614.1 MAG: hypothetical protein CO156_03845 [Candidatus Pacebacteria bacterium CG_4_9_14_3_um_filter_40_12]PJC41554.1 MAG: hypothetical protein CO041_02435 [Candidatus Pacebacteria bacterium CG_4_9_
MKRKILVFFTLCLIILGSSWALLKPGMFKVHDFIHGVRIAEMTRALQEGQFPVRWTENFGFGFGMPLYEFYAPLPYYVGSFFYSNGIPLVTSVKLLFLLCTIGTALGAYQLGKSLFAHKAAGILVSAAYTLAPYRALNLFVRGALSEAWGMMALPWILYGIVESKSNKWRGFYATVFGSVILLLSHNLTALIAAPFIIFFAIGVLLADHFTKSGKSEDFILRIGSLGGAAVLSLGLSAFYVFPAFLEKSYTQIEATILSGYFDFSLHFLYIRQFFSANWGYGGSEWGPGDPISFYLGTGQLIAVVIALGYFAWNSARIIKKKKMGNLVSDKKSFLVVTLFAVTIGALFMSLQRSISIWRGIEILSYIQFPWRYLSVASLGLALLTGVPFLFVKGRQTRMYLVVLYLILQTSTVAYFQPEEQYLDASGLYYDNPTRVAAHMSDILPDYIPLGVNLDGIQPPDFTVKCVTIACSMHPLVERGHERLYTIDQKITEPTVIEFAIADYPGWIVFADAVAVAHSQSKSGTILATLPAGTQQVGIQFQGTQVRDVSDIVSLISVVTLAGLYMIQHRASFFRKEVV